MDVTSFLGTPTTPNPANKLNSVEGTIFAPCLTAMGGEELLWELRGQGVTSVTRLRSRRLEDISKKKN